MALDLSTKRLPRLLWQSLLWVKTQEDEFDFLGRHVTQRRDFSIEVDMDKYLRGVERVTAPLTRRRQTTSKLTPKELHDYRSLVGQLAWPARQVMPQLAYHVSFRQQNSSEPQNQFFGEKAFYFLH